MTEAAQPQLKRCPPARPRIFARLARGIRPRRAMTVSEWADANRVVSTKQGSKPGPWVTDNNPPLREPMDAMSDRSGVHDVVAMWPIQFGKTELALNAIGYTMDHAPAPLMVCLPGEVTLNKWTAQKLQPMIDETPAVRRALTSVSSREAANSRQFKDFAGGQLYVEHAGSPARLKSTTVRKLVVDEVDEFAASLTSGDDPLEMLNGRTSAFPNNYQRLYISSPQIKATSRIWYLWELSDQRRLHVPCPHCGHEQYLRWEGLKWAARAEPGQRRRTWYVCRECGAEIEEYHKTEMIRRGRWIPGNPDSRVRGYHVNCLYYQLGLGPRWADLVEMWLNAQGDKARLKTFVNDRLAEPWEDEGTRHVTKNLVQERAQAVPLRLAPSWVLAVTAGIDTQDDRLEVQIIGWGRGRRWVVLDYVVLHGDTSLDDVWVAATDLLNRPIDHAAGATVRVEAASFDMLGHRTERVKAYVRDKKVRRPMASFGAKANTAPILGRAKLMDVTWQGKTDKRGVHVYPIGTVDAKHVLFAQLAADHDIYQAWLTAPDTDDKPEAPALQCLLSDDLPDEYFGGLVSEVYNPSKARYEKRRGSVRNEPLDTWVHAYAATHHPELRLHRAREADWARREADILARVPHGAPPATPSSSTDTTAAGATAPARPHTPDEPAAPAKKSVWHNYRNRGPRR